MISSFSFDYIYLLLSNTYTNKNFISITFQHERQKVKHLKIEVYACGF